MRFLHQILIGLIVFNAMLIMTTPFFPITYEGETPYGAKNITADTNITQYQEFNIDIWDLLFGEHGAGGVLGLIVGGAVGAGIAWATKSPIPIGACAFGGFVSGMFLGTWSVLNKITQNGYINGLIGIIGIILGILIAITIIESLMGQAGAD